MKTNESADAYFQFVLVKKLSMVKVDGKNGHLALQAQNPHFSTFSNPHYLFMP
jgi:hypothetical protein